MNIRINFTLHFEHLILHFMYLALHFWNLALHFWNLALHFRHLTLHFWHLALHFEHLAPHMSISHCILSVLYIERLIDLLRRIFLEENSNVFSQLIESIIWFFMILEPQTVVRKNEECYVFKAPPPLFPPIDCSLLSPQ